MELVGTVDELLLREVFEVTGGLLETGLNG